MFSDMQDMKKMNFEVVRMVVNNEDCFRIIGVKNVKNTLINKNYAFRITFENVVTTLDIDKDFIYEKMNEFGETKKLKRSTVFKTRDAANEFKNWFVDNYDVFLVSAALK